MEDWAPRTTTGDRAEVADLPDTVDFWREVSASSENCIGQSCPEFDACWITRMRQEALAADIVVVNHHLLCADLAVKDGTFGEVIPEYDTVVLDEAHLLEDVATQYFGSQVSSHKFDDLCRDVERELRASRLDAREVLAEIESLRLRADRLFKLLALGRGRRLGTDWMGPQEAEEASALLSRLEGLRTAILALPERPSRPGLSGRGRPWPRDGIRAPGEETARLLRRTRCRGVFLRHAHRRVGAPARPPLRSRPRGRVDFGHAGRGRRVRLPQAAPGPAGSP